MHDNPRPLPCWYLDSDSFVFCVGRARCRRGCVILIVRRTKAVMLTGRADVAVLADSNPSAVHELSRSPRTADRAFSVARVFRPGISANKARQINRRGSGICFCFHSLFSPRLRQSFSVRRRKQNRLQGIPFARRCVILTEFLTGKCF